MMTAQRTQPCLLEEMTLAEVRARQPGVAVLPMGATEPHNLHLPYGTDTLEGWHLCHRICGQASRSGARVVQLPALPYGTETNQQAFPLSMNLRPSTLFAILTDLVETLENSEVLKLVIFNSHGGNDFKPFLREIYGKTRVQIFLCNWYQMIRDVADTVCEQPEDHAGEMETSLILAFRPDLVARTDDGRLAADDGERRRLRFQALREGWVSITRPWHLLTTNSGSGNPHAATAEKGERLAQAIVERIAPFVVELAASPLDDQFPFAPTD